MDFETAQELCNPPSKAEPGDFHGLAGKVNATVYKTEPILTGLGHSKFSKLLTLLEVCYINIHEGGRELLMPIQI